MECVPSAELVAAEGTLLSSWSPRSRIQLLRADAPSTSPATQKAQGDPEPGGMASAVGSSSPAEAGEQNVWHQ